MGGNVGLTAPTAHVPRLLCPNDVQKLPSEGVRPALGHRESAPGPRRGSDGPQACGEVPSRAWVGRLFSARGCHVVRGRRAAGPQLGVRTGWLPPSDFKNFAKTVHPTEAGS